MFRRSLLLLFLTALARPVLASEAERVVIVASSRHAPFVERLASSFAHVIELLPPAVAHDLVAAGSRLETLPRVDLCVWNSRLDSRAEAMWVERLSREYAGCRVVDVAGRSHARQSVDASHTRHGLATVATNCFPESP